MRSFAPQFTIATNTDSLTDALRASKRRCTWDSHSKPRHRFREKFRSHTSNESQVSHQIMLRLSHTQKSYKSSLPGAQTLHYPYRGSLTLKSRLTNKPNDCYTAALSATDSRTPFFFALRLFSCFPTTIVTKFTNFVYNLVLQHLYKFTSERKNQKILFIFDKVNK